MKSLVLLLSLIVAIPLAAEEPLDVGVIIALSGDGAAFGKACQNGISMAVEEIPNRDHLRIHFEDDQNVPKNTITAFRKLTEQSRGDVIISFSSGTSKALRPETEHKQVPLIAIASDPEVSRGAKYTVNLWVTPEEEVAVLLEYLAREGIKKIARVTALHPGTLAIDKAFDQQNKGQVELVIQEEVPPDLKDFRSIVQKIKKAGAIDGVFINVYSGQVGLFARQLRELGVTAPLFDVELFEDRTEVELSKGALIGQRYVQADDPDSEFLKRYYAKYPNDSIFTAANCHDSILLISDFLRTKRPGDEFVGYLRTVKNFRGALGTFSSRDDNRFALPATIKVVTKDGFEKLR